MLAFRWERFCRADQEHPLHGQSQLGTWHHNSGLNHPSDSRGPELQPEVEQSDARQHGPAADGDACRSHAQALHEPMQHIDPAISSWLPAAESHPREQLLAQLLLAAPVPPPQHIVGASSGPVGPSANHHQGLQIAIPPAAAPNTGLVSAPIEPSLGYGQQCQSRQAPRPDHHEHQPRQDQSAASDPALALQPVQPAENTPGHAGAVASHPAAVASERDDISGYVRTVTCMQAAHLVSTFFAQLPNGVRNSSVQSLSRVQSLMS